MSSSTVLKVRAHLRIVSRSGHSQAVSRWAWPTMLTGGRRGRRPFAPAARPAPAGPGASCRAMSGSSSRLQARSSPAQQPGRVRARRRGARSAARRGPGSRARTRSNSGSRTWRSACCRVNSGAPSGSGSSRGHGLAPNGEGGLAAASTKSSIVLTAGGAGRERRTRGGWGRGPAPGWPSRQTRASAPNPVDPALPMAKPSATSRPAQSAGIGAPEAEPGGVPRRAPRPAHRERLVVGGEGLGGGDRLAVHVVGGHVQGDRRAPAPGTDEFVQDPDDPADADRVLGRTAAEYTEHLPVGRWWRRDDAAPVRPGCWSSPHRSGP